ncbi:DUF2645 family protein [Serratia sp. 509]|uniref:DUF2645 family protein n=1 Tax=Serratia sp. 509 TaxID=3373913 RepID=UPI003D1B16E9
MLVYLCMQVFSIGEYDWMRGLGDSVCSVPLGPDDTRDITAPLFLFFLGTPLLFVVRLRRCCILLAASLSEMKSIWDRF